MSGYNVKIEITGINDTNQLVKSMFNRICSILTAGIVLALASNVATGAQGFETEVTVLDSSPRYVWVREYRPERVCKEVQVSRSAGHNSHTPEIVGAIVGGALGKEISDSRTSKVAGALLGASIARDIEKSNQRNAGTTTEVVCETINKEVEVRQLEGYDVTYEFGGKVFNGVVNSNPGNRIRVWVSATPVN